MKLGESTMTNAEITKSLLSNNICPICANVYYSTELLSVTKEEVIKMLKTFTPLERAQEFEKLFLMECSKLKVKPMYNGPSDCDDESAFIEVYYGKQGAWNSKRLGFDFEPTNENWFWYIGRSHFRHTGFRGDGCIED